MTKPANYEGQQRDQLKKYASEDSGYASLVAVLGSKNCQDAWHIRTAEKFELFCFLKMDFRLIETLTAQSGHDRIINLKTCVVTPKQLGKYLGFLKVPPNVLSYVNASGPVRSDLSLPKKGRTGIKKRKLM